MYKHGVEVSEKLVMNPRQHGKSIQSRAKQDLADYLNKQPSGERAGSVRVQRICKIGYNRACYMIEEGIKMGVLERCEDSPWLHFIK